MALSLAIFKSFAEFTSREELEWQFFALNFLEGDRGGLGKGEMGGWVIRKGRPKKFFTLYICLFGFWIIYCKNIEF